MKASIDRSGCIACGMCVNIAPDTFRMADDGIAEVFVDEVPAHEEHLAIEAKESCPVSVIHVE